MSEDRLTEFAAILDEFAAAQRRQALTEARKQRISIVRNIGQVCQCTFETVVPEGTSADEIFALLAPIDAALDRLKAKSDLFDFYNLALNDCKLIEVAAKKLVADRIGYEEENTAHNADRRSVRVGLTSQQQKGLEESRRSMRIKFADVDEKVRAAAECRRILDGESPFTILREQVEQRLDAVRGARPADAA